MAIENDIADDRPKVYLETSFSTMRDNEIIAGIREARRAFAAKYGNDLRKIAEAADRLARDLGFKLTSVAEGRCSQTAAAV